MPERNRFYFFIRGVKCEHLLSKVQKNQIFRHCHIFMLKRQKKLLEKARCALKEDGQHLEERVMELQKIDAF